MSSDKKISKLVLTKFRGATTETVLEFDDEKPIVLIFGENGRGKSTIIDAIDFVCNKSAGSIKTRSSTDPKKHLSAIGHKPKDFSVTLHSGENEWTGRHNGKDILIDGAENPPAAFILRRNKLLRLVEAKPADRYDELRRFIDVDNVEKSEQVLREAVNNSKSQLDRFAAQQTEAAETLEEIWQTEGMSHGSAQEWAQAKVQADVTELQEQINQIEEILDSRQNFQTQLRDYKDAKERYETANDELVELQTEIAAAEKTSAGGNMQLIDLLKRAETYIETQGNQGGCPVCLSDYDAENLKTEIKQRLSDLSSFEELRKRLETKNAARQKAESVQSNSKNELIEIATAHARQLQFSELAMIESASANWAEYELLKEDTLTAAALENFDEKSFALSAKLDDLQRRLQKDLNQYNTITQLHERLVKIKQDAEEEDRVLKGLKTILEIVHRERITYTQTILDAVKDECTRLYEVIHPNEPYKLTGLKLDEKTKGSLHQLAHFDGHDDVSPQAYFSESHLDTLGFCFWLAVAKHSSGGDAIIVLDDAFTSVDAAHVSRIIELLTDEVKGKKNKEDKKFNQIIIATHQRRWHDSYRYGTKSQSKTQVYELGSWEKKDGVKIFPSKMEFVILKEKLSEPVLDRQTVCGKAGVLLEKMFDELAKHYRCSMPRNAENVYTLKSLCENTTKLFDKLYVQRPKCDAAGKQTEPLEYEKIKLKDLHQKISPYVTVRNQIGAHFNMTAEEYSDNDVKGFVKSTIDLAEALICDVCKGMALRIDKETGNYVCSCKQSKLRMFPNNV